MATINMTAADLAAVLEGGAINPDIMQQIMDVSKLPLEFTNRCGTTSQSNPYKEWMMDRYQAQDLDNAFVDGQDIDEQNQAEGQRVANTAQQSVKEVRTSTRADASDVIGRANTLSRQVARRAHELQRDVEGILMSNQGAVEDDGNTTAGRTAGLEAWIDGKTLIPAETGATTYDTTLARQDLSTGGITGGGWDNRSAGTKLVPAWDYSAVTGVNAITETSIKAVVQALYENTGSTANRVLMTRPGLHTKISDFYFTSSARIATLTAETNQQGPGQAMGAVNSILTNYGVLDMIPNNLQPIGDSTSSSDTAFILDFDQIDISYYRGYRTESLAKTGLSEKRMISVDYGLCVKNSEALGMIQGIDATAAMTA